MNVSADNSITYYWVLFCCGSFYLHASLVCRAGHICW